MPRGRKGRVDRTTTETDINITLNVDGAGVYDINAGVPFMDHMLALFAKHGQFDLAIQAKGDTIVDDHHTVEDIGICLGKAFAEAIGDKKGIRRYGDAITPMDEALVLAAIDISGRPYLVYDVEVRRGKVGKFDTELVEEFFRAFVNNAAVTLHIKLLAGKNTHHIIECVFKAFGRALKEAVASDPSIKGVLSTKGKL